MPAAALILPALEFFAPEAVAAVTGAIGAGVASTIGAGVASTTILGATTVADIATGAIIGAGTSAATAAIQGGDIGKAALTGAVSGGVGTGVSSAVSKALGASTPLPTGAQGPSAPATVGGSAALGSGVVGSAGQGAGALAGALAGGAPLSTALQSGLRGAELGGISGLAKGLAQYDLGTSPKEASAIGSAASQAASYALPSVSGGSRPSYTPPVQPGLSLQGPATQAPSPTLGQSLSIAPSLGYSPTGSVFGSSDAEGKKSNVWNVGSLRNIGAAEA